ncbi:TetR/AcrR family transcriptional regulator [Pedobacter nanyangensis]|uniref:TetR/AcrR family transcriptional regulator n=1 Tax=Pedobacter nanyangensis TaxID=1562389 RepID=UPI000DE2FCAB|nr:TetR/AcrR family transcriptional regulator [Pedobacter nanyangensis]
MEFLLKFRINEHLYLRNPESSEIGKSIIKNAINLVYEIGFEQFTFKKLAQKVECTEATIYRYFSSKHKLLTYILNWYWNYLEFVAKMRLQQITDSTAKLKLILEIITHSDGYSSEIQEYDLQKLHRIVISESSKSYLVKEVDEINKEFVFNPLKSLCQFIGEIVLEINPKFAYPKSLSSTLMETAHDQQFFSEHLPKLTDNKSRTQHKNYVLAYLNVLAFSVIK